MQKITNAIMTTEYFEEAAWVNIYGGDKTDSDDLLDRLVIMVVRDGQTWRQVSPTLVVGPLHTPGGFLIITRIAVHPPLSMAKVFMDHCRSVPDEVPVLLNNAPILVYDGNTLSISWGAGPILSVQGA